MELIFNIFYIYYCSRFRTSWCHGCYSLLKHILAIFEFVFVIPKDRSHDRWHSYYPCCCSVFLFPFTPLSLITPAAALSSCSPLLLFYLITPAAALSSCSLYSSFSYYPCCCSVFLFPFTPLLSYFPSADLSTCSPLFLAHLSWRLIGELIVYQWLRRPSSVRPSSVVRQHFQTSSPLKLLGQLNSHFIWRLLRMGERKFVQMVLVTWPRWLPRPYMVKTI